MIAKLYEDKKTRDATSSSKTTKEKKGKEKDDSNEPPPPASSYSSCLFSYHSISYSNSWKKTKKSPLFKLDVKF